MSDGELRPFRASVLHAGIEIVRDATASGRTPAESLDHIRQGSSNRTSFDYPTALAIAADHGWGIFADDQNSRVAFRETLRRLILHLHPPWVQLVQSGRARVIALLDEDVRQCIELSGLMGTDDNIVAWWDEIAQAGRIWDQQARMEFGRNAERRSLERERSLLAAVSLEPVWVSIEDNAAGYDIQSWRRPILDAAMSEWYIEVKASSEVGIVHLTRNEWHFGSAHADRWELQVWFENEGKPLLLRVEDLLGHVARNQGAGRWEELTIPTARLIEIAEERRRERLQEGSDDEQH